jgi:hypothetical protein
MRFSGQQAPSDLIRCDIQYRAGAEDEDLARLFIDAIKWLVIVVLNARTHELSRLPERERWTSELLLGYATLAVNEARALLLLLSGGLHRNARVHLRSLYEFELRMCRLLDESANVAIELRDAYAYEARSLGRALGTNPSVVEAEIAAALGVPDASGVRGGKEKDALGGNMREAMRDEPSPAKRYMGSVTWASQMSHGTVLALREVAKATDGTSATFFDAATRDALGNMLLYLALWPLLHFMARLDQVFDTGLPPGADLDEVAARSDAINARLHLVSPEEEARGEAAVTEHAKRKQDASRS